MYIMSSISSTSTEKSTENTSTIAGLGELEVFFCLFRKHVNSPYNRSHDFNTLGTGKDGGLRHGYQ